MNEEHYLYVFGYNTPLQERLNKLNHWGEENSMAIVIKAKSEKLARQWGRKVAVIFNQKLHNKNYDWINNGYADFVENLKTTDYSSESLKDIVRIQYGEYPEFDKMKSIFKNKIN